MLSDDELREFVQRVLRYRLPRTRPLMFPASELTGFPPDRADRERIAQLLEARLPWKVTYSPEHGYVFSNRD